MCECTERKNGARGLGGSVCAAALVLAAMFGAVGGGCQSQRSVDDMQATEDTGSPGDVGGDTGVRGTRPLHILRSRGDALATGGDYASALVEYKEYVERKPDDVKVRAKLADAYMKTDQPSMAREQWFQCMRVQPDNDDYLDGYAESLYATGQREELIEFLTVQTRERGGPRDYMRQGKISARLGNVDEAQNALLTAAKLDGGRTIGPQLALADFYRSLNDSQNEVARLRMALYLEPNNQAIKDRLAEARSRVTAAPGGDVGE